MLGLFVILFVVFFSVAVILWAGSLGLQGLIYSEPAPGLHWRAAAASAAVTALLAVWCLLDYALANPDQAQLPLDTIFRFQPRESKPPAKKLIAVRRGEETEYIRRETGDYRDKNNEGWSRATPEGITEAIIIEDGGQRLRFQPKLNREGKFVDTREAFPPYYEVGGSWFGGSWVMEQLGHISRFSKWWWFLNIFFNGAHFALWFAGLWLLARFQWPHALGLAVLMWAVMTLLPIPMVLERTRIAAREKAKPAASLPGRDIQAAGFTAGHPLPS